MNLYEMVKEFHLKFNHPVETPLTDKNVNVGTLLRKFGVTHQVSAGTLEEQSIKISAEEGDHRLYRGHLTVEESGEFLLALGAADIVELADAIGDLIYVLVGAAVTYGIPIDEILLEIHRSNMSKTRDPNDPRMRLKDPSRGYFPPDIEGVLNAHRKG